MASKWWKVPPSHDCLRIVSSNTDEGPLEQSSPVHYQLDQLDSKSVTDDLEDSLVRASQRQKHHNTLSDVSDSDNEEHDQIGTIVDQRGRRLEVSETRSRTRSRSSSRPVSRSKTPLKIRDNISYLLGWDIDKESDNEEEEVSADLSRISLCKKETDGRLKYHKPCSRLALLDTNQYMTFQYEIDLLKMAINDFPLYFKWVCWQQKGDTLVQFSVLENMVDLKVAYKQMKKVYQNSKIMVFKEGIQPKRKHKHNIGSVTVNFRVDHLTDFDFFKAMSKIVVDGSLYKPSVDLVVCGVELRKRAPYSIISLWVHPPLERFSEECIFEPDLVLQLIQKIQDTMPVFYHQYLEQPILSENLTGETMRVFEEAGRKE